MLKKVEIHFNTGKKRYLKTNSIETIAKYLDKAYKRNDYGIEGIIYDELEWYSMKDLRLLSSIEEKKEIIHNKTIKQATSNIFETVLKMFTKQRA